MLNHRRAGSGRRVVVLQHGFLGGSGYWTPQMAHLAPFFDVIAPDLPGFAGSAHLPPRDGVEDLADALVTLLDELGVARFSLVGHSMGGMVALQLALDHPERIDRLVLYGSGASGRLPSRFETFEDSIRRLEQDGIDATTERIAATWFMDGRKSPFYQMCVDAGRGASTRAATICLRAIPRWDASRRLGEVGMPTLIIGGDHDRSVVPRELVPLGQGIPGAQLCIAPGCAHNVHLERPELFNHVLTQFLLADEA